MTEREREREGERERDIGKGTQRGGFILISSLERERGGFEGQRERESEMENLTGGVLIERKKGKFSSYLLR